jgi:ABC-type proline/glycine betaine transport system permease subunit
MNERYWIAAVKALMITIPAVAILAFAMGEILWRPVVAAVVLFAVLLIVFSAHAPRRYDTPPSPDEKQIWWPWG